MLLKRFKTPNKGLYTPVGGKLEPHESPLNAAIRETFEETGINVEFNLVINIPGMKDAIAVIRVGIVNPLVVRRDSGDRVLIDIAVKIIVHVKSRTPFFPVSVVIGCG